MYMWRLENNFQESILSLYCAGSRKGDQVLRLLDLLSYPGHPVTVRSHTEPCRGALSFAVLQRGLLLQG